MADRFVDYQTKVCADWLNNVDWAVADALGYPKTPDQARANIGAVEEAPQDGKSYLRYSAGWAAVSTLMHNDFGGRTAADAHPVSSITNLQSSLNAKANLTHGHSVSDIYDLGTLAFYDDAPADGELYSRQNNSWVIGSGGGGTTDHRALLYRDAIDQHPTAAITGLDDALALKLEDAPEDGETYGRNMGTWVQVASGGSGGDHATLINRSIPDQHPQSAITGLTTALSDINTALAGKQATITGAATTIDTEDLTIGRAVISDGSGKVAVSATTAAEIGFVSGVTSSIQTQLGAKQATITGAATTITTSNLTVSRALASDASGKVAVSATTAAELGHLTGVASNVQSQLNAKLSDAASDGTTYARKNASWVAVTSGTTDHSQLTNRTIADQHSIGAVTGLQSALDGKQPLDADLTSIAGLSGTTGFLKKTAADSWTLDTSSYSLTSHTHSNYLPTAGGTMSGNILMGNNDVRGLRNAVFSGEASINPAATGTWYLYFGQKAKIEYLNTNMTVYTSSQGHETGHFQLRVVQDGTGGRTLDLSWVLADGKWIGIPGQPEINMDPGGTTIITIFCVNGTPVCGSCALVGKA